jgi:lipoyl(octanoyl) transferase
MNFWFLLNSGKCDAAFNMALDEALLENAAQIGKPVLRFYGWNKPAATFGYFQKFSEVERATHLRPLIRRPTGGGIVPHDADWTYSFAVPPNHEWHLLKAIESYRRIHEWIRDTFAKLKIETELAPCCKKSLPGQCFVGHEKFDLLWHGKKIAGAAQRRNKLGLLIQGSIQPPVKIVRADFENAMRDVARKQFQIEWEIFSPDKQLRAHAEALACQKYSQNNYNQKR